MSNKRGFSLIELVMTILIIGILTALGASLLVFGLENSVFTPNSLNMDMLAQEAIGKIVDGDNLAKGLRFSRQITASADNSVGFVDQDGKNVVITLDTLNNRLSRTINSLNDPTFLYYAANSRVNIVTGRKGRLFTYYDSSENTTTTAANVRRVEVNLVARTSSGIFQNWQGSVEQSSSVRVPKFQ